ncbi:MAG TPA: DNA-processing protein DprA [Propionibacteriaceae bacterium]|nr:DNA-processing protein DprA [Propionibacteriaceae bacterium]
MTGLTDRAARMALSCVVDCGEPSACELVEEAGSESTWAKAREGQLGGPVAQRAATLDLGEVIGRAEAGGIRFVVPGDDEWPPALQDLRYCDPVNRRGGVPWGLWLRGPGHLAELVERSVAVVGSRACTSYGGSVATDLGADLSEQGVTVVSGGAFGIDAAAHRGALAVQGATLCVLANGLDVAYPTGNAALIRWIANQHLLVSELPPTATPTRVRFLARNRVIAALSRGTVVVEAALRSGARNTATWALGCNRHLMAVPGPVTSTMSAAPHLLIRDGLASLVTGAADVLDLVSSVGEHTLGPQTGEVRPTDSFAPGRLAVYEALPTRKWSSPGDIALAAGVGLPACLAELAALESAGFAEAEAGGWRLAKRPVSR